jgi:hypothetical protein
MHQFLAKAALIDRPLAAQGGGRRHMCGCGLGANRLGRGVEMALNHQALQEKSHQSEKRHPPFCGILPGYGASWPRHEPLS